MKSFESFQAAEEVSTSIETPKAEHEPTALEQFRAEEEEFAREYASGPAAKPAKAFRLITDLAETVRTAQISERHDMPGELAA